MFMVVSVSDDKDSGVGKRADCVVVHTWDTRASSTCMSSMHKYYVRVLVCSSMNQWVERR